MNKISIPAGEYAASAPAPRGKWYARIRPTEVEGTIEAVEELLDHEPTAEDFENMNIQWLVSNIKWKTQEAIGYARGSQIKEFYVNGTSVWFDSETRASLISRIKANQDASRSTTIIYFGNIMKELSNESALAILSALERYSGDCFVITEQHKTEIAALTDVSLVESYDVTAGYPEKLSYTL